MRAPCGGENYTHARYKNWNALSFMIWKGMALLLIEDVADPCVDSEWPQAGQQNLSLCFRTALD